MKNVIFLSLLALTVTVQACAQASKSVQVPEAAKTAFNQKFPNAKKVKWELEQEGEYEAEFRLDGQEYSAIFTANGEWKETEHEIQRSEIPQGILAILDQHFTDYKIEEAELAETASGNAYEFEIEVGEQDLEVKIDAQGHLTQQKTDDDDDENDED